MPRSSRKNKKKEKARFNIQLDLCYNCWPFVTLLALFYHSDYLFPLHSGTKKCMWSCVIRRQESYKSAVRPMARVVVFS